MPTRRLFLAFPVPLPIAERVAAATSGAGVAEAGFRLVPARELHLTLRFLGPTAETRIPRLESELSGCLARARAPELELTATGAFPTPVGPRVLWVGVRESSASAGGRLAASLRAVAAATLAAGFEPDPRTSIPHLTVARRGADRRVSAPAAFLSLVLDEAWRADSVCLFESHPDRPLGARYVVRARFALALESEL